jgi:hypothetical protein
MKMVTRGFAFYAVLITSTAALADVAFFDSGWRGADQYCNVDARVLPVTANPIPPGSTVNAVSFHAFDTCPTRPYYCTRFDYRVSRIIISHNDRSFIVPDGTWHVFDNLDGSGTWSTGLDDQFPSSAEWGCDASVRWQFSVTYTRPQPPPTITVSSVAPSNGPTTGGTPVEVRGTNFVSGATVTFGGTPATNVTVLESTRLTANTPAHAAGAVRVTVNAPGRIGGSLDNAFTYVPTPPTVTAVAPTTGPNTGGTSVTITGTNFAPGATVTFAGAPATDVTFVNATTITATTPPHAMGSVDVVVTVNGQSGSMANAFTYVMHPAQILGIVNAILD